MRNSSNTKSEAALLLAVTASQAWPLTIGDAARRLGINARAPQRLAYKTLCASLEAGDWRCQRAEAEAKLRQRKAVRK